MHARGVMADVGGDDLKFVQVVCEGEDRVAAAEIGEQSGILLNRDPHHLGSSSTLPWACRASIARKQAAQ